MRYTSRYSERRPLDDGADLVLRMVRPDDKQAFVDGFARLSDRTRYQRFMAPKTGFTDSELAFLTEVDGNDHVAIVAAREQDGREPEGIGVARFVRAEDDRDVAELGIVVADAWQCRGIGRLLLERIVDAASERGIRRIRAQVLADNRQILGLLKDYLVAGTVETDHGVLILEFPIPERNPADVVDALLELLGAVAKGVAITPEFIGGLAAHPVQSVFSLVDRLARSVAHPVAEDSERS
jgi:RimJ/RimL family protein N-acetyltransferase